MTSPTLVVIPSASPAASMDSAAGSSVSPAQSGSDAFSSHLQAQQQAVQNGARSPAPSSAAKTQKTDAQPPGPLVPVPPREPALSLIDEDITTDTVDDTAESGLPALALSIMTEVQALRHGTGRADPHSVSTAPANAPVSDAARPGQTLAGRLAGQVVDAASPADARSTEQAAPGPRSDLAAPAMDLLSSKRNIVTDRSIRQPAAAASLPVYSQRAGLKPEPAAQASAPDAVQSLRPVVETAPVLNEQSAILRMPTIAPAQLSMSAAPLPNSAPTFQGAIATPVQSPEWGAALGRQFIALAQQSPGQLQSADIRLDPPELGPLRITLHVQDGVAHALITSPHAQVRQTIEQSLQQLQQQLADNGLSLGQADVGDQHASHQQFQDQLAGRNSSNQGSPFSLEGVTGLEASAPTPLAAARVLNPDALVDTFA